MDNIIGLFILGLIAVVSLPLLNASYSNFSNVNALTEMNYLGESIYERLVSKDDYSRGLIDELIGGEEVVFKDLNDNYLEKYESKIKKINYNEDLLEVIIIIKSNSNGGNLSDVEFKGTILK